MNSNEQEFAGQPENAGPEQTAFERALTEALELRPQVAIAPDFALRVSQRAAGETRPVGYLRVRRGPDDGREDAALRLELVARPSAGRRVAFAAVALLLAVFTGLSLWLPHADATHRVASLVLWAIFASEFIALTLWIAMRSEPLQ